MDDWRWRYRANIYSGGRVDRVDHRRRDSDWLARQLRRQGSRIIPLWRNRHFVNQDDLRPIWLDSLEIEALVTEGHELVFLGMSASGCHFGLDLSTHAEPLTHPALPDLGEFRDLREFWSFLPPEEGALLAYARGLLYWHGRHRYCGICGARTRSIDAGHMRRCTNRDCQAPHFPRTDPAVIMLVHDGADRCVLGRQKNWPPGRHSVLAGFVEPGENLEEAVAREVKEEVGLTLELSQIHYHSSQPWPFPSSIMLGFWARAEPRQLDVNYDEIESAGWFSRHQLRASPEDERFCLPSRDSIARRLLEDWIDAG